MSTNDISEAFQRHFPSTVETPRANSHRQRLGVSNTDNWDEFFSSAKTTMQSVNGVNPSLLIQSEPGMNNATEVVVSVVWWGDYDPALGFPLRPENA